MKFLWPALALFYVGLYYIFVYQNSLNIPFADDLSIVASIYDIQIANTTRDVLSSLLAFHNEHRLLVPRLTVLLLAKLNNGVIDFRWWVWAGNGLLIVILYVLYRVFANYGKPFFFFLPIVILLFQPVATELLYWGMASLQNIGVLTLAAIILHRACNHTITPTRCLVTYFLTGITILTGANGILLLIPIVLVLIIRRHYVLAAGWLVAATMTVWVYWREFIPGIHSGNEAKRSFNLLESGLSFLGLTGSFVESQRFYYISLIVGLIVLLLFAWACIRQLTMLSTIDNRLLFILAYSCFILLTMAAIATNRHLHAVMYVSRYKIYPVLLLICLYFLCLHQFWHSRRAILAVISGCILFSSLAYKRALPTVAIHQVYLNKWLITYLHTGQVDAPNAFMEKYYGQRLTALHKQSLYIPPPIDFNSVEQVTPD